MQPKIKKMSNQRLNRKHRVITERIIIKGVLILDTPICLGNGEADGSTDLMLLRDSITSKALLTGASLAGALRNYLHEYQFGYSQDEKIDSLSTSLFGAMKKDDDGEQSPLIIHDSISSNIPTVELRDGVKIDIKTGTAEKSAKYDLELLAAGTEFILAFELLIEEKQDILVVTELVLHGVAAYDFYVARADLSLTAASLEVSGILLRDLSKLWRKLDPHYSLESIARGQQQ